MKHRVVYGNHGADDRYFLDDREVSREEYQAASTPKEIGCPMGGQPYVKPILSEALAVHPSQIEKARERDIKAGVPTEYTKEGQPIITSHQHQKALVKSLGYFNKDAFC